MGELTEAISKAANGGNADRLLAAVRSLPKRPGKVDPQSDDDPGPIPGESFDDVTAAWCAGRLSDAVFEAATRAASGE
jgi:hypothetical protein